MQLQLQKLNDLPLSEISRHRSVFPSKVEFFQVSSDECQPVDGIWADISYKQKKYTNHYQSVNGDKGD